MSIQAILTDIEGTTSSISFVKEVLFPYAACALPDYVRSRAGEPAIAAILDDVAREAQLPRDDVETLIAQLLQWIAEDRKITPLKTLQGILWRAGYEAGHYRAHLYPEVAGHLRAWHDRGLKLYVYSSGSIAAQQLFFRHSEAGNLEPLFDGFFDTTSGGKRETASYERIAAAIALPADTILFLSDVEEELDAAASAGLRTCWLQRPADCPQAHDRSAHPVATDFNQILMKS
jgi:enolase-phosphatase E1